jgi:dephospho-CoA kinase
MLLTVGLTGGIASGKSLVLQQLRVLGCHTIDADEIVRGLYRPESPVYDRLIEAFTREILDSRGRIDRKKLGKIVFSDREKRIILNGIVHPAVTAEEDRRLEALASQAGGGIAVVDAALMIETGRFVRYDKIIVVVADRDVRLGRLMKRDAMTREEGLLRMKAQMPDREKKKFGDYVIENNGTRQALEARTRAVHACLVRDQTASGGQHA